MTRRWLMARRCSPVAHADAHLRQIDVGAGPEGQRDRFRAHHGGGITDNIPRVIPDGLEVVLQRKSWGRDPAFDWLAAAGKVAPAEMYRTFNCGIGMVVVVAPGEVDAALAQLAASGETASVIGTLGRGTRGVVIEE